MTLPEQVADEPAVSYIQLIHIVQRMREQGPPAEVYVLLGMIEEELKSMREIILARRPK